MGEDSTKPLNQPGDRSINIGRDASGSILITGDQNTASLRYESVTLPPPESVDIRAELAALRDALAQLNNPDERKVASALGDAEAELDKPEPDKDEIGTALERALGYAKKAAGFAGVVATLQPHVTNAAAWLGSNWHRLLNAVNLTV